MIGTPKDMRQLTARGRRIEADSFAIIDREVGPHDFTDDEWQVVRRVIHTTADFDFKELMSFHPDAVRAGTLALRGGCPIVVDVRMVAAGLNQARLNGCGCNTHNFVSDEEVVATAKDKNTTRSSEAIRKANRLGLLDKAVVAIGNAPTALLEVVRLVKENVRPALIIGVPVGFVAAEESKQALLELDSPYIVTRGRKGGSAIAVAIIHALLYLSAPEPS